MIQGTPVSRYLPHPGEGIAPLRTFWNVPPRWTSSWYHISAATVLSAPPLRSCQVPSQYARRFAVRPPAVLKTPWGVPILRTSNYDRLLGVGLLPNLGPSGLT